MKVWPAALLMADFIIFERSRWKNLTLLEIGGGVGFCGIVAAMFAQRVICTDYLPEVVQKMNANFLRNSSLIKGDYECRLLNVQLEADPSEEFPLCNVIFASDVIYSGAFTEALISFVKKLLQRTSDVLSAEFYLSLERRLNFTTEALAVSCPAYEYFIELCDQSELLRETLDLNEIPTYFNYKRSGYLELHRLTLNKNKTAP